MVIHVSPRKVALVTFVVPLILSVLCLAGGIARYRFGTLHSTIESLIDRFHLDLEPTFPTWYSSVMLLAAALLFGLIARVLWVRRAPFARHWAGLAIIFTGLSIDEVATFHDKSLGLFVLPILNRLGIPTIRWPWILGGVAIALTIGLAYARWVTKLPPRSRRGMLLSATMFLTGALGLELTGMFSSARYGLDHPIYLTGAVLEELLEMLAIALLITTLLRHYEDLGEPIQIIVGSPQEAARTTEPSQETLDSGRSIPSEATVRSS